MTFAISDEDWQAMKILCDFYDCSPGELLSVLIKKEVEPYEYFNKKSKTENIGE